MSLIGTALDTVANIGLYEYKRWRESNMAQQAFLIRQVDSALEQGDPEMLQALAPSLIKTAGFDNQTLDGLLAIAESKGAAQNLFKIKEMRAPQPAPEVGIIQTPTAKTYERVPTTERTRAQTAASAAGTIEGTLTGQESTRERRQRLALEERTSREGRQLFALDMSDAEARLRIEKRVGLDFTLPPTEDRWDDQGNQIRYDYKYNEKKKKWELDKSSGRVINPAVTQGDVAAVKKEIARVMGEIRKLDDIDYNESMKMALVEGMKKTDPVLASKISAIETKSEEGKRKLKAVLGSYLDDLRAMGNISDEEWLELVGPETAPQPAPANWGVDESGKVYRMTE